MCQDGVRHIDTYRGGRSGVKTTRHGRGWLKRWVWIEQDRSWPLHHKIEVNSVDDLVYIGYHGVMSKTVRIDQETHRLLKELAASVSLPMQTVIQEAVIRYSRELERRRVHEQISSFAIASAGTDWDLDEELEQAAVDELYRTR